MKQKFSILLFQIPFLLLAQVPNAALVGYWHNWNDFNAPYMELSEIDDRYNIIDIAFAVPTNGTDYDMQFIPEMTSQGDFISQVENLQLLGKKVIISIGGATAPVHLDNETERDVFISSMTEIINTYGFDGMDIDLEGSSVSTTGGTIENPVDATILNLIEAVKQIMFNYHVGNNQKLILTMAPETAFVHGGMSAYGGIWGAYLPVIDALRDSIDILHVQLYNSGSMFGIDGNIYPQGTADFIVAMTEAVIQGFNTGGGFFEGLPANKIAIGLPACSSAAGGGYVNATTLASAVQYLKSEGPQPGLYTLTEASGYADLRGLMTWSINWDAVDDCASAYEFADSFEDLFELTTSISDSKNQNHFSIYPNPVHDLLNLDIHQTNSNQDIIEIYNLQGVRLIQYSAMSASISLNISDLAPGMYILKVGSDCKSFVKQ